MSAVRLKAGVHLDGESLAMCRLLSTLLLLARDWPTPEQVWITSGTDGKHSLKSRHYRCEALDIRTHNFPTDAATERFRTEYEAMLGPKFRVLWEYKGTPNSHLHAQVKKGQTYP